MPLRNVLLDDFSGGIRGEHGTKRAINECADMVNLWPQGRNLRPMKSNDRMANVNAADSTDTLTAFRNHELYIDADGNEYLVARRNKTLWVGFKSTTNWGSDSTIDWRPLHGDVWSGSSLFLDCRGTAGAAESFQQVGSTLYFASDDPTSTDYLLRWDGFVYKTGTLKYEGVTSAGKGIYAHSTASTDFEAAGVKAGDILYLKNHTTSKWYVGTDATTHGFVIDGIDTYGGLGNESASQGTGSNATYGFVSNPVGTWRTTIAGITVGDYLASWSGGAWSPILTSTVTSIDASNGTHILIEYNDTGTPKWAVLKNEEGSHTGGGATAMNWNFIGYTIEADAITYYNLLTTPLWDGTGKLVVNTTNANQCFDTTGKGASGSNYVDYIIVRVKRAGNPTGTATAQVDATAGTLAAGTYTYRFRYYNSLTGYSGTISVPSSTITLSGSNSARVSGWSTTAGGEYIDTLQIFRSAGTGPYYLVKEYDRTDTYAWNLLTAWSSYYVDDGWAVLTSGGVAIQAEADAALYTRPGILRNLKLFNGRLYAFGYDDEAHYLKFSTLYNYESWPVTNWEYDTTGAGLTIEGGQVPIGANRREPLTAMVPEGGSFTTTGVTGSNLLIFSGSAAYRWYGVVWSDFNLVSAFQVGCVAPHSVVNANGAILFLNQNHVMALGGGSNDPQPASLNLWPCGIQTDMDTTADLAILEGWTAAFWNQCYFIAGTVTGTYNDTVWILHLPSGAWFSIDSDVNDMRVWDNPGSEDTLIISACESQLYSSQARIVAMFGGGSTSSILFDSGPIRPLADPKEMFSSVRIKSITCGWHGAADSVTVQMKLYDNFKADTVANEVVVVPVKPQDGKGYYVTRWQPRVNTLEPSLLIEANAYPGFRLEWCRIECEICADGGGIH